MREEIACQPNVPESAAGEWGWYLYGVIRRGHLPELQDLELASGSGPADSGSPHVYESGELAAIVRPVPLAEFGTEALRAHMRDAGWVETMVRGHNQVIAAIHEEQTILPAKFGCVYLSGARLRTALEQAQDTLLAQLVRLEGCDEWGICLYADRAVIQQRARAEHPTLRQLQHKIAVARPGRAYFLQRKLADALIAATEQALGDLAQAGYDYLVQRAVAGQVNPRARMARDPGSEVEILRAAFLVRRMGADAFITEVAHFTAGQDGLRCEYSGPWPPYSFAALAEEELR
jgi:hypothetical protein